MTTEDLRAQWTSIAPPQARGTLEAQPLRGAGSAWLARDEAGRSHLLLEVPPGTEIETVVTRGLSVSALAHQVAGRDPADFIDLACLDEAVMETFAAVVADVADSAQAVRLDARPGAVREALARWRWFWDASQDRLSDKDALGLFAELWFLRRWLGPTPDAVKAWTASEGARHDFQATAFSVEVKVTGRRTDNAAVHHIEHLDQLADPEQGSLYLFSLRVTRDRLAANSLPALVDDISASLSDSPAANREFQEKVARRGYTAANRSRHDATWRVLGERLYQVRDDFPRLTLASFPLGLPSGVAAVSYDLDMAVCADWLIADRASSWQAPRNPGASEDGNVGT